MMILVWTLLHWKPLFICLASIVASFAVLTNSKLRLSVKHWIPVLLTIISWMNFLKHTTSRHWMLLYTSNHWCRLYFIESLYFNILSFLGILLSPTFYFIFVIKSPWWRMLRMILTSILYFIILVVAIILSLFYSSWFKDWPCWLVIAHIVEILGHINILLF